MGDIRKEDDACHYVSHINLVSEPNIWPEYCAPPVGSNPYHHYSVKICRPVVPTAQFELYWWVMSNPTWTPFRGLKLKYWNRPKLDHLLSIAIWCCESTKSHRFLLTHSFSLVLSQMPLILANFPDCISVAINGWTIVTTTHNVFITTHW